MAKNGKPRHPLRKIRDEKGLTQAELSAILNLRGNTISQIEGGFMEMPRKVSFELCEIFNIDPVNFMEELEAHKGELRQYLLANI